MNVDSMRYLRLWGPESSGEGQWYWVKASNQHGFLSEGLGGKNWDTLSNVGPMVLSLGGLG